IPIVNSPRFSSNNSLQMLARFILFGFCHLFARKHSQRILFLSETIEEQLPNLIVDVKTTTAPATDKEVLPDIQEKL
ncbi:MAG: hypothetical protein AB1489_32970, partial [Acidobacteriota bacterium]